MIALGDNQFLRSIRDIRKRTIDRNKLERLYVEKEILHRRCEKRRHNPAYVERMRYLKDKINRTMFCPDLVTIVMDHPKHYEHMYRNGVMINGHKYLRFSCAAGQARVSTVVFCNEEIIEELERRLNNGRDMNKKIAPSKFNAYFGLGSSATYQVSEPRFVVVKDFENLVSYQANFVTECDWSMDDTVDQRMVEQPMNRTDGMGLISPELSERWAKELGLDYIPAQWIVRQSFLKGMVCTFPIHQFCEEINGGNYLVNSVYTDENGEPIKVDLRNVDMIISESQFKLWDSYPSMDAYIEHCHKNKLTWGVAQYSPKEAKDMLTLNYQFIQTLDLDQDGVEALCADFVDWITGVSYNNWAYMLLFLLGVNVNEEKIRRFLRGNDNWWMKALIVNPECRNDPTIKRKVREMIINRIHNGCMGEILVKGNFQTMVSDPFAYMQHVCGLPVTGLLKAGEFYCNYWNERGVTEVNTARSPQTFRCENVVVKLVKNEATEKWYRYCYVGFIIDWFGHEVVNWGGADYDGDIVASTDNRAIIDAVYRDELTVTYDAPKPAKKVFTRDDLYNSDIFSFGSAIGSITNKGTNAYALLPVIERDYGCDSEEYKLLYSRLQQCCVAQSKQIDKAKLGQKVKGIPEVWTRWSRVSDDDTDDQRYYKELMNRILIDRRPYFFKYRYPKARKEWREYEQEKNILCQILYGMTVKELQELPYKTEAQLDWLRQFEKHAPLIVSNSPMNLVCRWIEKQDFEIQKRVKNADFDWTVYLSDVQDVSAEDYDRIIRCYKRHQRDVSSSLSGNYDIKMSDSEVYENSVARFREKMSYICSNSAMVANALLRYMYVESPTTAKGLLWDAYGRQMVAAARSKNLDKIVCPVPDQAGDIEYLGKKYSLAEVDCN